MDKKYKIQRSFYFKNSKNGYIFIESPWLRRRYKIKISKNIEVIELMNDLAQLNYFYKEDLINKLMIIGFKEEIAALFFEKLYHCEIILDNFESEWMENSRYSRQMLFFENFEQSKISALDMQKKLKDLTVLIPGLGGYGTWLSLFCAQMGIGKIYLLDYDSVELSNLNRQVLYFEKDEGKLKVDVLKNRLSLLNSSVNIEGVNIEIIDEESLSDILIDVDMVYNSFGYFPKNSKYGRITNAILDSCQKKNVDCFLFNGSLIGPIVNKDNKISYDNFIDSEYVKEMRRYSIPNFKKKTGALSPRLAFGSSIVAWETIRYFLFNNKLLLDHVIQLNTLDYNESRIINLQKIN